MKIAAGVLIIVVAVLDLIAGFGYVIGGGATSAVGQGVEAGGKAIGDSGGELVPSFPGASQDPFAKEAKQAFGQGAAGIQTAGKTIQAKGAQWTLLGLFQLAVGGLGIAAGVVLFQAKAAIFAMVVGGLQILADLISCVSWASVGVTNILAIAVGGFVIYVGSTYMKALPGPLAPEFAGQLPPQGPPPPPPQTPPVPPPPPRR